MLKKTFSVTGNPINVSIVTTLSLIVTIKMRMRIRMIKGKLDKISQNPERESEQERVYETECVYASLPKST